MVRRRFFFCAVLGLGMCIEATAGGFRDFVRVEGDQLVEGDKPFRFISWNIPNLHLVEDYIPFEDSKATGWRLPDDFEIEDALATVRQMGGTVVRTYVLSVRSDNLAPGIPRHVLGPGLFNEEAFCTLDRVLQRANEQGVRLIVPFVCNWHWWGGRAQYAAFRGKTKEQFWSDPQLIADLKQTIRFVVMRTNTITGIRYVDEKAILCWETGNELECPPSFTREIARYIKTLDSKHPVMEGVHTSVLREESLAMPEVDIVTTHHYPGMKQSFAELIRENAAKAKGRKPYVVGEFGFVSTREMLDAIQATVETQTAGALAWSLRFRSRDGGFYWHSEPSGGNTYKAFHWPGSPMGAAYDEVMFMKMFREKAFQIRGLPVPPLPAPQPPKLLPITDVSSISWQGSVGANHYVVERALQAGGPWTVIADDVDESFVQYRPLFSDGSAPKGNCYYRVRARNSSGNSQPSNVSGPVSVSCRTLVDELADLTKAHSHSGLEIRTRECRSVMEDAHRAAGTSGSEMIYRLDSDLLQAKLYVFFPKDIADLKFSVSENGKDFRSATAARDDFPFLANDYGYWRRAIYRLEAGGARIRFLRIEFAGEAQISRVEIRHEFPQP